MRVFGTLCKDGSPSKLLINGRDGLGKRKICIIQIWSLMSKNVLSRSLIVIFHLC